MTSRAASRALEWVSSAAVTAVFIALWWRHRAISPASHQEAFSLLHAQLGVGGLWTLGSHPNGDWLGYWLALVPVTAHGDALLNARTFSLVCAAVVVFALCATAGRLWGAPSALVAGGFLLANPAIVSAALTARGEIFGLALAALATWLLVSRLESYQDLGLGPTIIYTLLIVLMVVVDRGLAPVLLGHLVYAATMKASPMGWRQLVPGWMVALAVAALLWVNASSSPAADHQGIGQAVEMLRAGIGSSTSLMLLAGAVVLIVVAIVRTHGNAFFDTGLGLGAALLGAQPLVVAAMLAAGAHVDPDRLASASTLGAALILACAAGQWQGCSARPLVALVLIAGVGVGAWRDQSTSGPGWRNDDGNPPLARDLIATAQAGQLVAIDEQAAPGMTAALAMQMGDQRLWTQARDELAAESPRIFVVESADPWASVQADSEQLPGAYSGTVSWITLDSASSVGWSDCQVSDSDPYADARLIKLECVGG